MSLIKCKHPEKKASNILAKSSVPSLLFKIHVLFIKPTLTLRTVIIA